jgi:hypothetical protein
MNLKKSHAAIESVSLGIELRLIQVYILKITFALMPAHLWPSPAEEPAESGQLPFLGRSFWTCRFWVLHTGIKRLFC